MNGAALLVQAGGRTVAIPAALLVGVAEAAAPARLPGAPAALAGIVGYGGAALPILDLRRLLDGAANDAGHPGGPVVVLRHRGHTLGCRVDALGAFTDMWPEGIAALDPALLELRDALPPRRLRARAKAASAAPTPDAAAPLMELTLGGRPQSLPVASLLGVRPADGAVPVPWADALAPALLLNGEQAIAVVRVDRLLGCEAVAGGPLVIAAWRGGTVAFAVDTVPRFGGEGAPAPVLALDTLLAALPQDRADVATARTVNAASEQEFLEVELGGRACLLPLGGVASVLEAAGRQAFPPAMTGAIAGLRAVGGAVLPVRDIRAGLGLSATAPLTHDVVVTAGARSGASVLSVERVVGLLRLPAETVHPMRRPIGPLVATVRHGPRRLWVLAPEVVLRNVPQWSGDR